MEIEQAVWGFTPDGDAIVLYTMRNSTGASIQLTNIGASVVSVCVPDSKGVIADVVLGYKDPLSYLNDAPFLGKTAGRYANRIAYGVFSLDGKEYRLEQNNGRNHLHGGSKGFANRLWESSVEGDNVVFQLISADGDQGYPGELHTEVVYSWSDSCELSIRLLARSNATTIVNLTNHAYFNLAGQSSGTILKQTLQLNADKFLPTDDTLIPDGSYADVAGTPMDFRSAKALGVDIDNAIDFDGIKFGGGYDTCFVVNGWEPGKMHYVGTLTDPISGRTMKFSSTQPAVQIYSGNFLQGAPEGKSGRSYLNREGVAIECQGMPDAPNKPQFPSQRLESGQQYDQTIVYAFSTI